MKKFHFDLLQQDKKTSARIGEIHTPHGIIQTPAFVPVGTQASVKSLTPQELIDLNTQIFFVNTYHMYLRPGMDVIKKAGGLHRFMNWNRPLITDSGGFQVFSLGTKKDPSASHAQLQDDKLDSKIISSSSNSIGFPQKSLVKIDDDGVTFQSHWDGSTHRFTPEKSIIIQHTLGADIILCFDDCTPYGVSHKKTKISMERTHQWALRSLHAHEKLSVKNKKRPYQALYGVIQGGVFQDLREESARYITSLPFDGIAIGGVSVGESKKEMQQVLRWITPLLPREKARHLLGVGEIDDIFALVERGVDTFDCVMPTRIARMGHVLKFEVKSSKSKGNSLKKFSFDITKKIYAADLKPISKNCACYTCRNFTRAYIHHLFRVRELLAYRLATVHNMHFVHSLMRDIRKSIADRTFTTLKKRVLG